MHGAEPRVGAASVVAAPAEIVVPVLVQPVEATDLVDVLEAMVDAVRLGFQRLVDWIRPRRRQIEQATGRQATFNWALRLDEQTSPMPRR